MLVSRVGGSEGMLCCRRFVVAEIHREINWSSPYAALRGSSLKPAEGLSSLTSQGKAQGELVSGTEMMSIHAGTDLCCCMRPWRKYVVQLGAMGWSGDISGE